MKIFLIAILFELLVFSNSCTESEVTDENDKTIQDLISRMTLAEKIGQMTQVDYAAFEDFSDIEKFFIGSVLWGGDQRLMILKQQAGQKLPMN